MPNWCLNNLDLAHDDPAMIARAHAAFAAGKFLSEFIPVPAALVETICGFYSDPAERAAHEARMAANKAAYGYTTWYDFRVAEWGTKWDVGSPSIGPLLVGQDRLIISFDSAWSPPVAAYKKLEALGFTVVAMYFESGCAFAGTYRDGEDSCYSIGEETIPDELNSAFGISEETEEEA